MKGVSQWATVYVVCQLTLLVKLINQYPSESIRPHAVSFDSHTLLSCTLTKYSLSSLSLMAELLDFTTVTLEELLDAVNLSDPG